MKRIRYRRFADFQFTEWFTIGPNLIVRGVITPEFVVSVMTFEEELLFKDQASNMREAKAKLRALLIQAGVKLEDEIRHTTP